MAGPLNKGICTATTTNNNNIYYSGHFIFGYNTKATICVKCVTPVNELIQRRLIKGYTNRLSFAVYYCQLKVNESCLFHSYVLDSFLVYMISCRQRRTYRAKIIKS